MISYLPLLLVVITVPLYAAFTGRMNMTYSMEKGPSFQSICGRNVLMPVNAYQHKLVSRFGNAGGNCFATLMIGMTSKLTCKICVSLEGGTHLIQQDDFLNITFTGEEENILLTYGNSSFNETCFHGRRLDILVVEDEGYARTYNIDKPPHYSFNFALKPECSEEPICKSVLATVPINATSTIMTMTYCDTKDGVIVALSVTVAVLSFVVVVLLVVNFYFYCNREQQVCKSKSKNQQKTLETKETSSDDNNKTETNEASVVSCNKEDELANLMEVEESKHTADNKDKGNK